MHMCVCIRKEGEAQRQGPCKGIVHLRAVAVIPNLGDSFLRGEKSETGCLQRQLTSSPTPVVCADPLPRMLGAEQWSCSQGKCNSGYIFRCLGNARPHTETSPSPLCLQTDCKLALSLLFFGHPLTRGLHSQGIMAAKNSPGHKPAHSSKN